jgi:glc operon protein GlcG
MRTWTVAVVAIFLASGAFAAGFPGYLAATDADGVAMEGRDPVALVAGTSNSRGKDALRSCYEGAIYLFLTVENKTAFDQDPGRYAPQFGGFCVASLSEGNLVPGRVIGVPIEVDGKRYLLSEGRSIAADTRRTIARAAENWPGLVRNHATAIGEAQLSAGRDLTLDAARAIAGAAAAFAKRRGAPGASIAVVDSGGHPLLLERLDGTYPASAQLAIEKARTAAQFRRPSRLLEESTDGGRTSLVTMGYVLVRGAFPILWKGEVVGAIGVSGAAGAWQDEEIALVGTRATFGAK